MDEMTLNFKGYDSWDRPVYECNERLFVDVDPRSFRSPEICTKCNNEFDGEPDTPIEVMEKYKNVKVIFNPQRIVWK